jgi:CheY-like chemotaxis protein
MASVSAEADASLRSIPIIAVTSYALSGEEKKARAAGQAISVLGLALIAAVMSLGTRGTCERTQLLSIQNVIFFGYPM